MEVMVTVVILSTGIVLIYQAFLLSLDRQRYLVHRLYANNLLDAKIGETQRLFQERGEASAVAGETLENIVVNNKRIPFTVSTAFENPGIENFLQMDIAVSWPERGRLVHLSRSVCISRH